LKIKEHISNLIKILDKKNKQKFIRSDKIKQSLKDIYALGISISQDMQENEDAFSGVLEEIRILFSKDYFVRLAARKALRKLAGMIDDTEVIQLKKGVRFKDDVKELLYSKIIDYPELSHVLSELKLAEKKIERSPDNSCMHSREACEEFFRVLRINRLNDNKPRESLSSHVSALRNSGIISNTEHQFLSSGLYGFLSGKGKHANTEKKESRDALFGFKLSVLSIDQFIELYDSKKK